MGKLRTAAKRGAVLATVAVVLGCVALFVRAYEAAAPPAPDAAGQSSAPSTPGPEPSPAATRHPRSAPDVDNLSPTSLTLPRYTLTPGVQPGFTIAPAATHRLVISVSSARPVSGVGYVIPTSPDLSYGTVRHIGRHWSAHTTVTGSPYYAAVFVQADASGTAVTCAIKIDGVLKSSKTTSGPYGRKVCLA